MIWWVLGALAALLVVLPVLAERRRKPLESVRPAGNVIRLAQLSQGQTHYRWDGPKNGPVAVCVHGLTTGSYVWDPTVAILTRMGYRVLRYDLYGRGYSDRPAGTQDRAFFLTQLEEILDDQGVEDQILLIGYSMGGSIAAAFTAQHPQRIDRLVLLAPAGLGLSETWFARICRQVPLIGDALMGAFGGIMLRRGVRASSPPGEIRDEQLDETRRKGYLAAVLSSQRHMLAEDLSDSHAQIAARGIPVLAIWGEQDGVIPITSLGQLAQINRRARHETIAQATHTLGITHPKEIQTAIQAFLRDA